MTKPYKVYISGAITGRIRQDVENDFNAAEDLWRAIGIDTVNPLRNGLDSQSSWRDHIKTDIALLLDCQAVHFLPGWEMSRGARVEYQTAREAGMDMYMADNGIVNIETFDIINSIIRRELILPVLRIASAIRNTLHVTFSQIQAKSRHRSFFFARMVFAHECRQFMPVRDIAMLMRNNGASVRYFLRKYNDEIKWNPEFAKLVNEINHKISVIAENAPKKEKM